MVHGASLSTKEIQAKHVQNVEIAGVPFRLKSSHDSDTVNQLVRYLNSKIQDISPQLKSQSLQNTVILAALNIVEEMFEMKRQTVHGLSALEAKVEKLSSDFETLQLSPAGQGN